MNRTGLTYLTIGIALLGIWFFALYLPYQKNKIGNDQKIAVCYQQLNDFSQTLSMFPAVLDQKKTLDQKKELVNSKLYTKEQVLALFNRLKRQANEENLAVIEITPPVDELLQLNSSMPDSTAPQFLNIGMSLNGDYLTFGRFISALEKENYFRGINRCIISRTDEDKNITNFFIGFKALLGNYGSGS